MPAPKPLKFRRRALDLIVQRNPVAPVARELGISESCLRRWMERHDVDSGRKQVIGRRLGRPRTARQCRLRPVRLAE